jgi:hypothetical protein
MLANTNLKLSAFILAGFLVAVLVVRAASAPAGARPFPSDSAKTAASQSAFLRAWSSIRRAAKIATPPATPRCRATTATSISRT